MPRIPKTIRVPNPDYYTKDRVRNRRENSGYPIEDFYPEEYGKKLPDEGGWILLLMDIKVGRQLPGGKVKSISVPRFSIWFATPAIVPRTDELHQAVIQTKAGQVHVWPHEYNLTDIEKWLEFTEEDGLTINFLSKTGAFDEMSLFYLRSRGIGKAEAQRMLLPTLKDPNYCYLTMHPAYRDLFPNGTGTPYFAGRMRRERA